MSEKIKSEAISRRRALSLLGLAAAFGLAVPPTVLMVSDAEAQYTAPAPAPAGEKTGTEGGERRHKRRKHREERRHKRRKHREERYEERRKGSEEKKEKGTEEKKM